MNTKRLFTIAMILTALAVAGSAEAAERTAGHPRSIRNAQVLNPKNDSTWDDARRAEHEDFVRAQEARFRREIAAREWTEKDYWIAIRVISSNDRTFARSTKPYTEAQYRKAVAIRDVYEAKHPEILRHHRREPVVVGTPRPVDPSLSRVVGTP